MNKELESPHSRVLLQNIEACEKEAIAQIEAKKKL
jgi:hypothetical protein